MKRELKDEGSYKRLVHTVEAEDRSLNEMLLEEIENIYTLLKQRPLNDLSKIKTRRAAK